MPHQPFPLADYEIGTYQAKQPFLSPNTAYRTLDNGRVYRGRLEKRSGYQFFAFLPSEDLTTEGPNETTGEADAWGGAPPEEDRWFKSASGQWVGMQPASVLFTRTYTQAVIPPISQLFAKVIGFENSFPNMGNDVVTVVSTNCVNPANDGVEIGNFFSLGTNDTFIVNWALHPEHSRNFIAGDLGIIQYYGAGDHPVTGISNFELDGVNSLLAFDTHHAYLWSDFDNAFSVMLGPGASTEIFTGDLDDKVWSWPTDQFLVFTNSQDPVYKWTPGASPPVDFMPVDLDPAGNGAPQVQTINRALLAVEFRGRMVYLNVTEDGEAHFRRARWTISGNVEVFDEDGLGWADAPASFGNIRTAGRVGDRLMVGFDNGWMELARTGDPASPFEWLPITSKFGAGAKLTTIEDGGRLLTRSETSMQAMDPNTQYPIDSAIPDTVKTWNTGHGQASAAARNELDDQYWWSYVSSDADVIDKALVAQYDDQGELAWSSYSTDFLVYGEYEVHETLVWNELPGVWNDYTNTAWDDQGVTAGAPMFLGGKADGVIYRIGLSSTDDGEDITFRALTQALSPFKAQTAHLGWVDVYAEASVGTSVTLEFYDKVGGNAYKSVDVDFSPVDSTSKVYRRVRIGRNAAFHQIAVSQTGDKFFAIDAIIPWFRPTAPLQDFG